MALGTPWIGRLLSRGLGASVLRNRSFSSIVVSSTSSEDSFVEHGTTSADEDGPRVENRGEVVSSLNEYNGWVKNEVDGSSFEDFAAGTRYLPVTFEDVSTANYRIRDGIIRSPCTKSRYLSDLCGMEVYLKQEFMQ